MAKPLANGYPIGAVLLRDTIASTMTPGKVLRTADHRSATETDSYW